MLTDHHQIEIVERKHDSCIAYHRSCRDALHRFQSGNHYNDVLERRLNSAQKILEDSVDCITQTHYYFVQVLVLLKLAAHYSAGKLR